jgi:hypothetical protein
VADELRVKYDLIMTSSGGASLEHNPPKADRAVFTRPPNTHALVTPDLITISFTSLDFVSCCEPFAL